MQLELEDLDNLRHMLGVNNARNQSQWGYRNYFAPGGSDIASMDRLEKAGLVRKGRKCEETYFYHATELGCKAIGFNDKQIKQAMEP